jgi:hypothetical protein
MGAMRNGDRLLLPALSVLLSILLIPEAVLAASCGDDIHGLRVACRCGDTVVGSTRLLDSDPVVTSRCPLDGLVVRAADDAESITIDLAGHEIRGSDAGVGLRVIYGGTDGAQVVGGTTAARGTVRGFGIGLWATREKAIARVEHLVLQSNRDEGARLKIAGTVLVNVLAERNGRDGFHVNGTGGRFSDVVASENGENGLRLYSDNAAVHVRAVRNGRSGIIVDGSDNDLESAEAVENGRDGIVVRGPGGTWEVAKSEDNARDDLRANGRKAGSAEGPQ